MMRKTGANPPENTALGIAVIIAAVCAMAFADAIVKYASASFPLWQIYVIRSLLVIAALAALALYHGHLRQLALRAAGWAYLRALLLTFMYVAIYAAAPILSLATIAAALYTGPLFIALFSALLAGEPVGLRRWAAISLGLIGVLVSLRPGSDSFSIFALIPVLAALLYALAAIVTRAKCRAETPMALAFALNVSLLGTGLIATALLSLWQPSTLSYPFLLGPWTTMGSREALILFVLAILMLGISTGLAKAYQVAAPAVIATFDYSYLVFAAFWGFVIFSETPDTAMAAGMLLIAGAGLLTVDWRRARLNPR